MVLTWIVIPLLHQLLFRFPCCPSEPVRWSNSQRCGMAERTGWFTRHGLKTSTTALIDGDQSVMCNLKIIKTFLFLPFSHLDTAPFCFLHCHNAWPLKFPLQWPSHRHFRLLLHTCLHCLFWTLIPSPTWQNAVISCSSNPLNWESQGQTVAIPVGCH